MWKKPLRSRLHEFFNQTFTDFELIVINDGPAAVEESCAHQAAIESFFQMWIKQQVGTRDLYACGGYIFHTRKAA
jgi:hypothetical protein